MTSVILGSAQSAEAQYSFGGEGLEVAFGALVVVGGLAGVGVVVLSIADIVSFANDDPYSPGLAVLDLTIGTALAVGGVVGLVTAVGNEADGEWIGVSLIPIAVGALLITHGIWSTVQSYRRRASEVSVFVTPTEEGAMVGVGGRF